MQAIRITGREGRTIYSRWTNPRFVELRFLFYLTLSSGEKGDWDFRISDLVKTLMELIFNSCGEFRCCPVGPVSQIHSPHLHVGALGIFSDLLRSVQMVKSEWAVERNGKLPAPIYP